MGRKGVELKTMSGKRIILGQNGQVDHPNPDGPPPIKVKGVVLMRGPLAQPPEPPNEPANPNRPNAAPKPNTPSGNTRRRAD